MEELTPEQKAKLPEFREKWIKIGMSTDTNREISERAIDQVYRDADREPPTYKIWLDNPFHGIYGAYIMAVIDGHMSTITESIPKSEDTLPFGETLKNNRAAVLQHVYERICSQVELDKDKRKSIEKLLEERDENKISRELKSMVYKCGYGSHDASWLGFYDFFGSIGADVEKLKGLIELSQHCGWWWPFENCVILTPKPSAVHMENEELHCDGGPALDWNGTFKVWALNGVIVPEWLAETRDVMLDVTKLREIENAEVRREFVRKVGVERIAQKLGAETRDRLEVNINGKDIVYELLAIDFRDGSGARPYLKMLNPSIGVWHVEGVPPEVNTVMEALHSRKPDWAQAIPVREDGEDWFQQGDVVIIPEGAKSIKPFPKYLT